MQSASARCAPSFRTIDVMATRVHVQTVILADAKLQSPALAVRDAVPGYWHNRLALGGPSGHEVRVSL